MATLDDIISAINQRENHGPRAVGPLTQQAIAQSDAAIAPADTPANAPAGEACNSGAGTDALERVLGDCAAFDAKHADCSMADARSDEHVGFKGMTKKLEGEGKSAESAKKIAASIGFEKYGKAGMERKAAAAKAHG